MGYYSDVKIACQANVAKRIYPLAKEFYRYECCTDEDSNVFVFSFPDVKWYEGYEEVDAVMDALRECNENKYGEWYFLRIGEEYGDVEELFSDNAYDTAVPDYIRIERSIETNIREPREVGENSFDNVFDTEEDAIKWGREQNTGKYEFCKVVIGNQNVLLCQTNLVYEDEVWNFCLDELNHGEDRCFVGEDLLKDVADCFDIDLDEISYMDCKGERRYHYDRKLDEEIIRIYQNRVIDPKKGENYDLASDFRNAVIMAFEQTSGYKILEVFDEC